MAITQTNKLGLPLYSAGTDPHPGRVDHNSIMAAINDGAMGSAQGLHAVRPGAGISGRVYFSTDRSTFSYDNGSAWVELVPIGGVAPAGVRIGPAGVVLPAAGGTEGTSAKLARADHTHAIPLASAAGAAAGLMASAESALLAAATDAAAASSLVRRDASGRISVGGPTAAAHAATKTYVDTAAANASGLTTGTVPVARLPLASAASAGVMSASHYSLLEGATTSNTANTLVTRSSNGRTNIGSVSIANAPVTIDDATRKDYVDAQVGTRAPSSHQHDAGDITSGLINEARIANATVTLNGLMSSADKSKLDAATSAPTDGTLVTRYNGGETNFKGVYLSAAPVSASHATRKDYVDGKTWDGADITSGLINQARIANATPTLNGLMSSVDKSKLDGATIDDLPNTLAIRNAGGDSDFRRVNITDAPTGAQHATRKDYVDGKTWDGAAINSGLINPARIANVTSSLDGLMSKTDKAKLDAASVSGLGNTLMMRASNGATNLTALYISSPTTETTQAARKDYVDGKISDLAPGGWVNLSLASGWTTLSGYGTPQARLNGTTVELRGTIQRTNGVIGNTIFTLPAGHIPGVSRMLSVPINTTKSTRASVTGGTGAFYITSENTDLAFVGLDGVQFEK